LTVAIGAPQNDGNGGASGHVRVYDYVGTDWVQRGVDLDGEATSGQLGTSVSLSADGLTLAIGAPYNATTDYGYVRVYEWNGNLWSKVGLDIEGASSNDELGISVDLSEDGTTLVIGAQGTSDTDRVEVYDWDGTSWNQRGLDITGNAGLEYFGYSVSVSSDGNRFAVGAYQADDNGTDSGRVEVYDWNGTAWVQVGSDIVGEAAGDQFGIDVSLSSNGSRLAVGADLNDGNGDKSGHVRIFDWDGTAWIQVLNDIDGEAVSDQSGYNVELSGDGKRVIIGAYLNDGSGIDSGHARVYLLNPTAEILTYTENDPATVIYSEFSITDVDDTNIETATVHMTNFMGSEDVISYSAVTGIAVDATTAGMLLLSGSTTLANYETFFAGVTYQNTSDDPDTTARTVTYVVNDGDGASNTITATINILAVNDAPAGTDNTLTILEDVSHTFTSGDFGFSDPVESDSFYSVIITTTPSAGSLELSSVAVTVGQEVLVSDLANLIYSPVTNANGTSYSSFTFQVKDDGGTSNGGVDTDQSANTITFDVTAVNDVPEGSDNTLTIVEDNSHTFTSGGFGFSDPVESDSFYSVIITTTPSAGSLELSSVAVTASQEVLVSDLANLIYSPVADANGASYSSFTFQVKDDGGTSNGGVDTDQSANTITFDVTAVNDEPTASNNTITTNEDTPYTFSASDFNFSDVDGDSLASVQITSLETVGDLKLNGTDVTLNQVIAVADITNGLLVFSSVLNANGASYDSFNFSVNDGTTDSLSSYTMTVDVTAVNDEPTASNNTITINEDTPYTFSASDFNFSDVDGDSLASVQITSLETVGDLKLNGTDVTLNQVIAVADITNGLLVFSSVLNANGASYDSFNFSVNDGAADSLSSYTMTVDVTAVNDAPAGSDNTLTILEDGSHTFASSDFGFSDPNDS
ncbi:Ig-like domain-containing protein, partial [Thiotrichales bacterium 19S11-10]|nr:Ig-like domain-containing protein [Thiotrichales bacterium 19S11-10]